MTRNRWFESILWSLSVAALALFVPLSPLQAANLDAKLKAKADGPPEMVDVIVQTPGRPSDNDHGHVRAYGGNTGANFTAVNGFPARVPAAALKGLSNSARFSNLSFDAPMKSFYDHNPAGTAIGVAEAFQTYGATGAKIDVAIVDSGAIEHSDLSYTANTTAIRTFSDYVDGGSSPIDPYGHGSHVAGLIAGGGQVVPGFAGVAPGAHLHIIRVLDETGAGTVSDVLRALDWIFSREGKIQVVNLSLGHPVYESYTTDPLCLAIKALAEIGVVVVVSAGNYGRLDDGTAVYASVTSPGHTPYAITVGAMNPKGTADRGDDVMATFSSKGPTAIDGLIKPDLVAPGVFMVSLDSPGSYMDTNYGDLEVSSRLYDAPPGAQDYFLLSGTSMSAPIVTGIVALMLEQNPSLTPNLVKAILMYTAEDRGYDVMTQGAGYVNAVGALEVAGKITDSPDKTSDAEYWLSEPLSGESTIGGQALFWGGRMLWGDALFWGGFGALSYDFESMWDQAVFWGNLTAFSTYDFEALGIESEAVFWNIGNYLTASAVLWPGLMMQDIVYGEGFTWNGGKGGGGGGGRKK
ncbi:MAG: S8 family peptidase [Acidobacteriota bacterium]